VNDQQQSIYPEKSAIITPSLLPWCAASQPKASPGILIRVLRGLALAAARKFQAPPADSQDAR